MSTFVLSLFLLFSLVFSVKESLYISFSYLAILVKDM